MGEANTFGAWLDRQLARREVSQSQLAAALDVSRAAVSAWVNNRAMPRADKLSAIERYLELVPGASTALDEPERGEVEVQWYHRKAHADGGREYGNAAAFAFDADLAVLAREATQNSLDERYDKSRPVRVKFTLHELSGETLNNFLGALQWSELEPHYDAAAQQSQKVGRVLAEGLRQLRETNRLLLLRIDDYNASGLTGSEYADGRYAAVVRRQLDSHKENGGRAGGSYGLGKATLWATSRLGLVLMNSTLSRPYKGLTERRVVGRLDLPWREVSGVPYAGPAWFGEPDSEPEYRGVSRSWWADQETTERLHLKRENAEPGTSFLIVGAHDAGDDAEKDSLSLADMHAKLVAALANNFWASMTAGRSTQPLLHASVTALRNHQVVIPDERVDPREHRPSESRALQAYLDGDTVGVSESSDDVTLVKVPLMVPPLRSGGVRTGKGTLHEAVLLVTSADGGDSEYNRVVCMRGSRMTVQTRRPREIPLGTDPFQAVLLAGYATGREGEDVELAEAFLRASEPPEHDKWDRTDELAAVYARGALSRLNEFRTAMDDAVRSVVGRKESRGDTGPAALRERLRLGVRNVRRRNESPPVLHLLNARVDAIGAWHIEAEVRVPQRDDPWLVAPVAKFDVRSGGRPVLAWAELSAGENCHIEDGVLRIDPGARDAFFSGVTDVNSHPVKAALARLVVDLQTPRGGAA
ncbi:helix-turn-helix transcriptional regulator [Streptomyces sp. UNOC14_S4]|uniref:helix-turn-helix domain-containing protein n=1 Tax=Streptomyces sp. UNOC14_S4 TaxID=2872340 RepID=UPI001E5C52A8|nr:helix-turn-helix transcriptional regulator [Streptomyces sp. UNOC14_S4]MCC3767195.1 helix-turn-helix domain-containing protein [Streptomyces sp. UNOC14_S4]